MDHCVFIHTNHKQIVGALVAEHALRRNSRHNDKFDVRLIEHKDYPFLRARERSSQTSPTAKMSGSITTARPR